MQTFFIRYLKETINKETHAVKLEEKEEYHLAEDFAEAYKKAHEIPGAYTIEVFDIENIIHDIIILKNRIQFMTENETNYNSEFLSKFDKEFKKLEAEKNKFNETLTNAIFKNRKEKKICNKKEKQKQLNYSNFSSNNTKQILI